MAGLKPRPFKAAEIMSVFNSCAFKAFRFGINRLCLSSDDDTFAVLTDFDFQFPW